MTETEKKAPTSLLSLSEQAQAQAVAKHFLQSGFDAALGYLFHLWENWGIDRMNCFYYTSHTETYHNLLALYNQTNQAEITLNDDFPPVPHFADFSPLVDNNFNFDNAQQIPVFEPYSQYSSFVRFPFAKNQERQFLMTCFSTKKGTFTPNLVARLEESIRPLGQNLEHENESKIIHIEDKESSAYALLTQCSNLSSILKDIDVFAPTDMTILISGETGTGKEIVADAIYEKSLRNMKPFIKMNCGAIPETLLDSTLFGHEKGSFTGASMRSIGYFEQANNATLFLDEIGELSLSAQVRLLRVLDRGVIQRVGNTTSISVDVRVIAATNKNLQEMVQRGEFRADLWYRLAQFPICIPPLRDRKEDIFPLVEHFINSKLPESAVKPHILRSQIAKLLAHPWYGNVRELKFIVERALVDWNVQREKNLQFIFSSHNPFQNEQIPITYVASELNGFQKYFQNNPNIQNNANTSPQKNKNSFNLDNASHLPTLEELCDNYINAIILKTRGKIDGNDGAAQMLGIHPQTLYRKVKKNREDRK